MALFFRLWINTLAALLFGCRNPIATRKGRHDPLFQA